MHGPGLHTCTVVDQSWVPNWQRLLGTQEDKCFTTMYNIESLAVRSTNDGSRKFGTVYTALISIYGVLIFGDPFGINISSSIGLFNG